MIDLPESSIVKILYEKNEYVVGAGVLIGKKWVLTCRHVIESTLSCDQIYLTFHLDISGKPLRSHVIFLSDENEPDIAILELDDVIPQCARVGNLVIKSNFWDHKLKFCGFSSGKIGGWIEAVGRGRADPTSVQIDVSSDTGYKIEDGFSGTPVFDAELNYIIGIIVSKEISEDILSGRFIPVSSIINVCKKNYVDTIIFECLYDILPPNSPLVKIAKLIAASIQRLPDKERINQIIMDIVEENDIKIPPWLRDGDLCLHLAIEMLNLNLDKTIRILDYLEENKLSKEERKSIFALLMPYWVDSQSAGYVSELALHKDNKKAIALNGKEHFSAKMCINRASGSHPGKWPTYSCSGKYGIDAKDEIVKEIEDLLRTDLLRSGYLQEEMNPYKQREKIKMFIQYKKKNSDKPTFFVLNYSKDIANLLTYAQEVFPYITLFLLTGDTYPQPSEFGELDCACLLNLGLKAETQILTEICCACYSLGFTKRVIDEYISGNYGI